MSSSAPSSRMNSVDSTLVATPYPFNLSRLDEEKEKGDDLQLESPRTHISGTDEPRQPRISVYRSISYILGFKERYSLLHCFVYGGALWGFCLARSIAMNPSHLPSALPPGEWFWLSHTAYKVNLMIHVYLATLGGLGAIFQFFPAIRRRKMILHRLNGYGVLFSLIVGNICGAIVARRSFGGELNVQSAYFTIGAMIVFSGCMGLFYVKRDTRRHRKWMMRMVVYFGATILARLIMFATASIITLIGSYFSVWRCDEVVNLLDLQTVQSQYPQCLSDPSGTWVAVSALEHSGSLYYASALRAVHGMALWIAILIHVVGVEIYINKTDRKNQLRLNFALEPLDLDTSGS